MSARKVLVSVVVPCFNEEAVIGLTHRQLIEALGGDASFDLEIVYVNDGSHDRTEALLFELADQDPRVKVVSFTRNFGHQPAVSAGLEYAGGDAVAVIDADLQDPPEVILRLVAKWREGYDVVNAVREKRKEGLAKRLAYALFYKVYRRLASIDVPLDSGDFALMDRRVVDVMNALPEKNRFVRGLRSWSGFRQTGVAYERASRAAGETKYSFAKLLRLAFDGIVNFSTAPLSLIFGLGVATAVDRHVRRGRLPGRAPLRDPDLRLHPGRGARLHHPHPHHPLLQRRPARLDRHPWRVPRPDLPGDQDAADVRGEGGARRAGGRGPAGPGSRAGGKRALTAGQRSTLPAERQRPSRLVGLIRLDEPDAPLLRGLGPRGKLADRPDEVPDRLVVGFQTFLELSELGGQRPIGGDNFA